MGIPSRHFAAATASRSIGGARAKSAGDAFERLIELSAARAGIVLVRVPNGARWIGPGKIVPVQSPFDYCGCLHDGKGLFFDAKSLSEKYASFPLNNPAMCEPHQLRQLSQLASQGAIAGLLVLCGREQDYRWLPGRHLLPAQRIAWTDPRWIVLGPAAGLVPFARLFEAHFSREK